MARCAKWSADNGAPNTHANEDSKLEPRTHANEGSKLEPRRDPQTDADAIAFQANGMRACCSCHLEIFAGQSLANNSFDFKV